MNTVEINVGGLIDQYPTLISLIISLGVIDNHAFITCGPKVSMASTVNRVKMLLGWALLDLPAQLGNDPPSNEACLTNDDDDPITCPDAVENNITEVSKARP